MEGLKECFRNFCMKSFYSYLWMERPCFCLKASISLCIFQNEIHFRSLINRFEKMEPSVESCAKDNLIKGNLLVSYLQGGKYLQFELRFCAQFFWPGELHSHTGHHPAATRTTRELRQNVYYFTEKMKFSKIFLF